MLNIDATGAFNVVFTGSEAGTASDTAGGTSISFSEIEEIWAGSSDDTLDARASGWGEARVRRGQIRHDKVQDCHHLLLPRHALISVEGLWVESFWPCARGFALLEVAHWQGVIRAQKA